MSAAWLIPRTLPPFKVWKSRLRLRRCAAASIQGRRAYPLMSSFAQTEGTRLLWFTTRLALGTMGVSLRNGKSLAGKRGPRRNMRVWEWTRFRSGRSARPRAPATEKSARTSTTYAAGVPSKICTSCEHYPCVYPSSCPWLANVAGGSDWCSWCYRVLARYPCSIVAKALRNRSSTLGDGALLPGCGTEACMACGAA